MTALPSPLSADSAMLRPYSDILDFVFGLSETDLAVLPAVCLIAAFVTVFLLCRRREEIILPSSLLSIKMIVAGTLACAEVSIIVSWRAAASDELSFVSGTAISLGLLCLVAVTNYQHRFTLRSTGMLAAWYVLSTTCDLLRLYRFSLRPGFHEVIVLSVFALLLKVVLMVLDEIPKAHGLQDKVLRERISAAATAGFWSRVFLVSFCYSMIFDFSGHDDHQDIAQLLPEQSSDKIAEKFHRHWNTANKTSRHSLLRALYRTLLGPTLKTIPPQLLRTFCLLAQPALLSQLLVFVDGFAVRQFRELRLVLAGMITCICLMVSKTICYYTTSSVSISMRGILTAAIHAKVLKLPHAVAQDATTTTLIDNDVQEVVDTIGILTQGTCSLVTLSVSSYWLVQWLGMAFTPILVCMIMYYAIFRYYRGQKIISLAQLNDSGDHRVSRTKRMLSQLKPIRITGLDQVVSNNLASLCRFEVEKIVQFYFWTTVDISIVTFVCATVWPLLVIGSMYKTSTLDVLSPIQAFPYLAVEVLFIEELKEVLLITSRSRIGKALESAKRVQEFLCLPENDTHLRLTVQSSHLAGAKANIQGITKPVDVKLPIRCLQGGTSKDSTYTQRKPEFVVQLQNVSLSAHGTARWILRNMSLCIKRHELVMVAGITGSGKSTFLRSLVNDGVLRGGVLAKEPGNAGYCDQKLWLRQASVRDNIVGNLPFDHEWYDAVLTACLLKKDLLQLANGDQTLVGSNGSNLSGAQGHRVALARALYLRAPYLVLDNTFAGLDYGSYCEIFNRLFGNDGLLKRSPATVIMTTHSTTFLEDADRVFFIHSNGNVSMHTDVHSKHFRECWDTLGFIENETESFTDAVEAGPIADSVPVNETTRADQLEVGDLELYKLYLSPISYKKLCLSVIFVLVGASTYGAFELYMRFWSGVYRYSLTPMMGYLLLSVFAVIFSLLMTISWFSWATPSASLHHHQTLVDSIMVSKMSFITQLSHGNILHLFSSEMLNVMKTLPLCSIRICYDIVNISVYMTAIATTNCYCLVLMPLVAGGISVAFYLFVHCSHKIRRQDTEAAEQLSHHLQETIAGLRHIRAFGSQSEMVRKSISLLDRSQLPYHHSKAMERWLTFMADTLVVLSQLGVALFAICFKDTTSSAAVGASLAITMLLGPCIDLLGQELATLQTSLGSLARIRDFVERAPKEKVIEAEESEPDAADEVRTETGQGAAEQPDVAPSSDKNATTKPKDNKAEAPKEVDVKGKEKSEKEQPKKTLPADWPSQGHVVFTDVTARYDSENTAPPAIQGVSIDIPAGQKVGIVGRTGSGKTSLLMALLNFLEYSGSITVDGFDISRIPQLVLRQKITTISQDVIDLDGTVQFNLCPWTMNVTDKQEGNVVPDSLRIVLQALGMWQFIVENGGVTAKISEIGLSHGQLQLLTIGRGMLHNLRTGSNVVIMDELTSHLDPRTEKIVQAAMDKAFVDRTVISVVHREGLLKGADIVLRMKDGKIVEKSYPKAEKAAAAKARAAAAQQPPRVIPPALQAMIDHMNDTNAADSLEANRQKIAELRLDYERSKMGLPPLPSLSPSQEQKPTGPTPSELYWQASRKYHLEQSKLSQQPGQGGQFDDYPAQLQASGSSGQAEQNQEPSRKGKWYTFPWF